MAKQYNIHGGHYCGLNVPEVRESGLPLFSAKFPSFTRSEIQEILADPGRMPARKRFAPSIWIKSQGSRGSCQGYASAKALERSRVILGQKHVPLSGEFLYAHCNGGRDQGSNLKTGMQKILSVGVAPESMVKHQAYLLSQMPREATAAAPRFKAAECYAIDAEDELATAIAMNFVCVIAVHVGGSYSSLDSQGVRGASNGAGNHATGACDLRIVNGEYQFDEFGSWGLRNGQNGHAWVTWRRSLASTVRYHQFYAIRAVLDDPQGDNPPVPKGA